MSAITFLFTHSPLIQRPACEYCLRALETAEENARRLSGIPALSLPHQELCRVRPELHQACPHCQVGMMADLWKVFKLVDEENCLRADGCPTPLPAGDLLQQWVSTGCSRTVSPRSVFRSVSGRSRPSHQQTQRYLEVRHHSSSECPKLKEVHGPDLWKSLNLIGDDMSSLQKYALSPRDLQYYAHGQNGGYSQAGEFPTFAAWIVSNQNRKIKTNTPTKKTTANFLTYSFLGLSLRRIDAEQYCKSVMEMPFSHLGFAVCDVWGENENLLTANKDLALCLNEGLNIYIILK